MLKKPITILITIPIMNEGIERGAMEIKPMTLAGPIATANTWNKPIKKKQKKRKKRKSQKKRLRRKQKKTKSNFRPQQHFTPLRSFCEDPRFAIDRIMYEREKR